MSASSVFFLFSSRRRHTRSLCDWSSDVCSSDLDHGMRVGKDSGKDKSSAQSRSGIVGARKLADRQILKIPFPASHGASQAAQQSLRVGGSQKLNRRGHALAAGFVESRFQKV